MLSMCLPFLAMKRLFSPILLNFNLNTFLHILKIKCDGYKKFKQELY